MLETLLTHVASAAEATGETTEASGDIMSSLGIDWQMLAFQIIGFALIVFLLGKFVFPILLRSIDERNAKIEEGLKAAREAEDNATKAQSKIDDQLAEARREAKEIVATAKDEATAMLSKADEKAKQNAKHVLDQAHDEISKEVIAAKKALHNETLELVASATERVIGKTHSAKADKAVIAEALKGADK